MTDRKSFLLRLPPKLMEELNRWAKDDLRSLNAQIEFLLRDAIHVRRKKIDGHHAASHEPAPSDE